MQVKKVLTYGGAAFVAFFLFTRPGDAANAVRGAMDTVYTAANSLAQFVSHLS
ncbi:MULTISPECIES: hypothetical protein [Streptosporangium]|uniref:Uncharacterized protein n=3 Tax=Streptosporangium TaxID=2000 RepID=D2BEA5_STRRD|nr:hypothetical protein [Streptosporangium brasiliense]ACZ91942.1 hypothetical protein Sros_9324 [Streptosporangium roseum DSM 43021]MDP9864048.1 hypothetical protein [Streptosporangium brasiliense]SFJ50253.1 hypothetical protein SAMN05216275_109194 [Streptosporangium canum]